MRRFFVDPENLTGSTAILAGSEAHHISKVLRLKTGAAVLRVFGHRVGVTGSEVGCVGCLNGQADVAHAAADRHGLAALARYECHVL